MIFVDTGAWVALEDKRDSQHAAAIRLKQDLLHTQTRLITSNFILDETLTLLLLDVGYMHTLRFKLLLDGLIQNNAVALFHVTPDLEAEAWGVFVRFNRDKRWSFTDCTSKALMERLGVLEVFSFDHHFANRMTFKKPCA